MSLYWQQLLSLAAINAIAAWAVTLAIRSGQLSVANAAFAGIGAYLGGVLCRDQGWTTEATLVICFIAGGLVGAAFRVLLLRLEHLLFALATLAVGVIATVIASTLAPGTLGGSVGLTNVKLDLSPVLPAIVLAIAVAVELLVLRGSAFDTRIRLSAEEPQLVSLSGKPPGRAQILAFGLSTGVLAVTGALWIHVYGNISPTELGFERSFLLVVYAVVGGAYSGYGAMVAAIALTLIPQSSNFLLENQTLGLGLFLVVVILFRRGGILDRRPVPVLDRLTRRTRAAQSSK
jgi:branched-chain amino acid transport system permease protein